MQMSVYCWSFSSSFLSRKWPPSLRTLDIETKEMVTGLKRGQRSSLRHFETRKVANHLIEEVLEIRDFSLWKQKNLTRHLIQGSNN